MFASMINVDWPEVTAYTKDVLVVAFGLVIGLWVITLWNSLLGGGANRK